MQRSAASAQRSHPACPNTFTNRLASLGASGRCKGNMYRDLRRFVDRHTHMELQALNVKIPFLHSATGESKVIDHPVLLPHETFHWLSKHHAAFDERILGGSPDASTAWWRGHSEAAWWPRHPARGLLEQGRCVAPLRLYGDDAEVRKGKSALVLTWSSSACKHLKTKDSRFLITSVNVSKDKDNTLALDEIYRVTQWSFQALERGVFPETDPDGEPWEPDSWRAQMAGKPLDSRRDCRALLAEFMGDWKWIKECLGLKRHYGCRLCCHLCGAQNDRAPYAYDFGLDAAYLETMITEDMWRLEFIILPWLARIPGFSLLMCIPDPMHLVHLGVCLVTIGSTLFLLLQRGMFGVFGGKRSVRISCGLAAAYVRFKSFAKRNRLGHSQHKFTIGMAGMSKPKKFPEMKAKAHNAAVIVQWLNYEVRRDPAASDLERSCLESLAGVLAMMHAKRSSEQFTATETMMFVQCGRAYLSSYSLLSSQARRLNVKLWPMRPKHHQMLHLVNMVRDTHARPGWAFADEDYNGQVLRALRGTPNLTMLGPRTVFSARFKLWRSVSV